MYDIKGRALARIYTENFIIFLLISIKSTNTPLPDRIRGHDTFENDWYPFTSSITDGLSGTFHSGQLSL